MRAWLAIVVVACSQPAEHAATGSAAPPTPPVVAAADAPPAPTTDPPEPTAPQVECNFERRVHCMKALDNDKPYQPPPFIGCPRTDAKSQFSAAETRAAWTKTPGVCCYVEFIATQCR